MKPGKLMILWDYDTAIGQINASYPYKYDETKLIKEINNVDLILGLAETYHIKMTFACVGFAAEPGLYPFHVPEQIRNIYKNGHEIASHSWRHEWFPYLEKKQIQLSLERSKKILEKCIQQEGSVTGFILPFNRPMTWYSKGSFSIGDRALIPWYPGSNIGSMLKLINAAGYKWTRVTYNPIWKKVLKTSDNQKSIASPWPNKSDVICIPNHYVGFDDYAQKLLHKLSEDGGSLVISGHPCALDFGRSESLENLRNFLIKANQLQKNGLIETQAISEHIKRP